MKRTFLVKKDPTIEAQDNWLIMDYRQYAAWRETDEGKNREIVFGKFEACSEDDSIIFMECRINAENPEKGFRPSPGTITDMYLPGGKGIRIDSAIYSGYTIPPYYDSMVAKLIVWAKNRQEAIRKMQSALGEVIIEGIDTNVDYQYGIVNHPDYIEGNIDIEFIERL